MNRLNSASIFIAIAIALVFPNLTHAQITQGQIDTFEAATTMGWSIGSVAFVGPSVQPGGPGGASDHFLQLISGGTGPPRWVIFNQAQWTGNYNTPAPAGSNQVNAIEMDIANFSSTVLATRIAFKVGAGQTPGWVFNGGSGTGGAIDVQPNGVWTHVVFPINDSTMVPITDPFGSPPPTPLSAMMSAVGEMRILHAPTPSLNGSVPFTGRIGIDNIHAFFQPVPEPTSILAAALCVGLVARPARRWWKGTSSAAG